jgi:hypothetical protein
MQSDIREVKGIMHCHFNTDVQQTVLMMKCCSVWAHKCSQLCCAQNKVTYHCLSWNTKNYLEHPVCRSSKYWSTLFLSYLQKNTTYHKWIPILPSVGTNTKLLPHSYSWHCISNVNSNCVINCVTVCVSDNTAACTELSFKHLVLFTLPLNAVRRA